MNSNNTGTCLREKFILNNIVSAMHSAQFNEQTAKTLVLLQNFDVNTQH